jgi:hypothetical protein
VSCSASSGNVVHGHAFFRALQVSSQSNDKACFIVIPELTQHPTVAKSGDTSGLSKSLRDLISRHSPNDTSLANGQLHIILWQHGDLIYCQPSTTKVFPAECFQAIGN